MTKVEIRAELISRGFDGFAPEDLDRYINWGYFYLARKLRIQGVEELIPFSLDPGEYVVVFTDLIPIPKSVRRVVVVTPQSEQELMPLQDHDYWRNWSPYGFTGPGNTILDEHKSNVQEFYYVYNGQLFIMPALQSYSRDFVMSTWMSVQEMQADTDTYALPIDYEELLLTSAMRVCHIRANEQDRATNLMGFMDEQIRDLLNEEAFIMDEQQDQVERDDPWWYAGLGNP